MTGEKVKTKYVMFCVNGPWVWMGFEENFSCKGTNEDGETS